MRLYLTRGFQRDILKGRPTENCRFGVSGVRPTPKLRVDRPAGRVEIRRSQTQRSFNKIGAGQRNTIELGGAGEALVPSQGHGGLGVEREDGTDLEAHGASGAEVPDRGRAGIGWIVGGNGVSSCQVLGVGEVSEEDDRVARLSDSEISLNPIEARAKTGFAAGEAVRVRAGDRFEAQIGEQVGHMSVLEGQLARDACLNIAEAELAG